MWKFRVPAIILFLTIITFTGAENRAARLESNRWTAAVFVHCRGVDASLETGLAALIRDDLEAISNLDVVEGRDLLLASRAVGEATEPDNETIKKAGIDAALEVTCKPGQGRIEWEGSLTLPAPNETLRIAPSQTPLRQVGQIPSQFITSVFSQARDRRLLPSSVYTQNDQALVGRLVRPQYDTIIAYGRGLLAEKGNVYLATRYYREALLVDPDFYPPYARLFYTVYFGMFNTQPAEMDIVMQTKVRLNSVEALWIAKAFYDLALMAKDRGWIAPAETYHNRSLALLKSGGKEKSLLSSFNLSRIGEGYLQAFNRLSALYNIQTAREIMESQGLDQNVFYAINLINLATLYSLDGKTDLAIWLVDRATRFNNDDSLFTSFLRANAGAIQLKTGSPEKALDEFRKARAILKKKELAHSTMYLTLLVSEANTLRATGDTRSAEKMYESVIASSRILGLEGSQFYIDALSGIGMTHLAKGDSLTSQSYLRMGYFFQLRLGPRSTGDFFTISQIPIRSPLGLVEEEQKLVGSYTGAYSYYAHSRAVQSRTYAGRLDDTNVLLKDLLDGTKTADPGLNALRAALLGSTSRPSGEGIHFIDIGPAIANLQSPGVTAVSVARDFPSMNIIALDLPEQVELFRHQVHPALRSRVIEFPNFFILSGNGVAPLRDQLSDPGRWFEPRKQRRSIQSGDPIVIRAANSIDIYESWAKNEEAMTRIATDYAENPVLYLFNRSLLFKPSHSTRFTVVGLISRAGFDHMYQTFDRGGERAYTLIEF